MTAIDTLAQEAAAAEEELQAAQERLRAANEAAHAADQKRRREADDRQERFALSVLASYPDDIRDAQARVDRAYEAFVDATLHDFPRAIDAYLEWQREAAVGNGLAVRLKEARSYLRHRGYFLRKTELGEPFQAVRRTGFGADRDPVTGSLGGAVGAVVENVIRGYRAEVSDAMCVELEDVRAGAVVPNTALIKRGQALAFETTGELDAALQMRAEDEVGFKRLDPRVQRQVERYGATKGART